jgi:hypothetical protein
VFLSSGKQTGHHGSLNNLLHNRAFDLAHGGDALGLRLFAGFILGKTL